MTRTSKIFPPLRLPLRQHLAQGGKVSLQWLSLGQPALVEIAETSGAEGVVLDLQHGLWTRAGMETTLRPISGAPWRFVRLADHDRAGLTQALDAGADGIIAPLVETAEQAARLVSIGRYPPHGERSVGGVRPLSGDLAAYVAQSHDRVAIGVMIETAAGLASVDAIAATPGLDFLFIGAGDLALALGEFPQSGPKLPAALRRIQAACQAAGIACGIYSYSGEDARARRREGFSVTVLTSDIAVARHGFDAAVVAYSCPD